MRVEFSDRAAKQLRKLEKDIQRQVAETVRRIEQGMEMPEKLAGVEEYKVRSGDYRIILEVYFSEGKAFILRVMHRSKVYKR